MPTTLARPRRARTTLGPEDDGRAMSLNEFDRATAGEGFLYELNKGMVEVSDVPSPQHLAILLLIRNQLILLQVDNPGTIQAVTGSMESKILLEPEQSERHPDLSVYLTPPPATRDIWSVWVPAIVVEVVSKSSARRDYEDKPDEYAAFGVSEYWIVDPFKNRLTAMTRFRGRLKPKAFKPGQKFTTAVLPGFSLDLTAVLAAGK